MISQLPPKGQEIVKSICNAHNVSVKAVIGQSQEVGHIRRACWVKLRNAGIQNSKIAKAFGVTAAAISQVYARRGGTPRVGFHSFIDEKHLAVYKLAAEERGIDVPELMAKILNVIAQDDIFNAVLDDQ